MVKIKTSRGVQNLVIQIPREVKRILTYLDTLEDDEVIETDALKNILGYTRVHHSTHISLDAYRFRPSSGFIVWGKPVAIKAYQEEINE